MRICVTGGAGFQGTHLIERLLQNEKNEVVILNTPSKHAYDHYNLFFKNNPRVKIYWGSVNDKNLLEYCIKECDFIFHLASKINVDESKEHPDKYYYVNVWGTYNILELLRKYPEKGMIYASTCEVYGGNAVGFDTIDEKHPLFPRSPYAASKAGADTMIHAYCATYGIKAICVRPFNIYGERQKGSKFGAVIPKFFELAMNDQNLNIFGSGKQGRDFMHVSDVIEGYMKIFENRNNVWGHKINLGTGVDTSINDLANHIVDIVGKGKVIHTKARQGEVRVFIANTEFAKEMVDWKPKVGIREGLERYYQWLIK